MNKSVFVAGVVLRFFLLAAGVGVAQAQPAPPAPPRPHAESVAEFPDRAAPGRGAPQPVPVRSLPGLSSGFQNEEQLRNELLSHSNWGSG
jgi:hypothetical protein